MAPGESISLLCTAEANPAPQVSWEGPNGTVSGSGSGLLTLTSVQPNADGEYSCVATNVVGSDSLQIRIIVTVPPQVSAGILRYVMLPNSLVYANLTTYTLDNARFLSLADLSPL